MERNNISGPQSDAEGWECAASYTDINITILNIRCLINIKPSADDLIVLARK